MLLSVIVPVFNTGEILINCIDSILQQTIRDFEIIIVDDGSTDSNTKQICDNYTRKFENVVLITKNNGGAASARNAGISASKGHYIGFVDSDDEIHPNMYNHLLVTAQTEVLSVVFCDKQIYGSKAIRYPKSLPKRTVYVREEALSFLMLGYWHSVCTALYAKSVIQKHSFPEGETNEDYIFQFNVLWTTDRIGYIGEKYYRYIKRSNSITTSEVSIKSDAWIAHTRTIQEIVCKSSLNSILKHEATYQYLFSHIVMCNKIALRFKKNDMQTSVRSMYNTYSHEIRKCFFMLIFNSYFSLKYKICGLFLSLCPFLYIKIIPIIKSIVRIFQNCNNRVRG